MSKSGRPPLERAILDQLRTMHVLKTGALSMFDPMLRRVATERDSGATSAEVAELLARMHGVFSGHREETAEHSRRLAEQIGTLGGTVATGRIRGLGVGARAWVAAGGIGGQNHGANARNAFVFEHLEIAGLKVLSEIAERSGDELTGELAAHCLEQDQAMAATIDRNWTNVLTLTLAG